MRGLSLCIIAALTFAVGSPALSEGAAPAPLQIPGLEAGGVLEGVCPRVAPMEMDINGDGHPDFLIPSNHKGKYHEYLPPEVGGQFGLIGALMAMKADTGNKNFTFATAIDGLTGKPLWEFQAGGLINEFVLSTDGSRLYVASHDNRLYALEIRTGAVAWSHDFGGNVLGLSASSGEIVAMTTRNRIMAIGATDGKQLWEAPVKASLMQSGWGYLFAEGDDIFIGSLDNRVACYDRKSGKQKWNADSAGNPSLRALGGGTLLFADVKGLTGLDAATGKVRWTYDPKGKPYLDPIRLCGDVVVGFNGRHGSKAMLFCLEMKSGKERWTFPLEKVPADKERHILLPEDQDMFKSSLVAELSSQGTLTSLYVADRAKISALDPATAAPRWTAPIKEAQAICLGGSLVLAQDKKKVLSAFDATTGKALWTHPGPAHTRGMVRMGDLLLCSMGGHILLVLNAAQGSPVIQLTLREPDRLLAWGPERVLISDGGNSRMFTAQVAPNPGARTPPPTAAPNAVGK